MNKIIKYFFLSILVLIPVFVNAGSFSSDTSKANSYLQRDTFSNSYKKYLLYNNLKFGFQNGKPETNSSFTLGGFISEEEYKLTIPKKGSSYLLTGDTYWTLTPNGGKYKVIEYSGSNTNELNSYESDNTRPKARVTEYVAPNTSVSGTGRQNDPWIFEPMFRVNFKIPGSHATIEGSNEKLDGYERGATLSNIYLRAKCKGTECTKKIKLIIEDGYNYISDTCDGSFNYDTSEYTVNNLTKDVECKLTIGIGKFHVNLVKGDWEETRDPSPNNVYLRQRENYYRENEYKNIIYKLDTNPERYGYSFKGYSIISTTIKVIDETGKFIDKTSIKKNNENIISDWQKNKYTITFNPNGGKINVNETSKEVTFDEPYGLLPLATRAGYSFKGWFTTATNNEQIKETDIVKYAGNRSLYAQWVTCPIGTYNTGDSTTCTSCPTGYTSLEGSTAENQCYMIVPTGKYLVAKNSSYTNCEPGKFRTGEIKKFYGESISCEMCAEKSYSTGGASVCTLCPDGYNVKSGEGISITSCTMSVPAGKQLEKNASAATNCSANTWRSGPTTVAYGNSVTCTACPNGYSVGAGSGTSESSCTISVPAGKQLAAKSTPTNCGANTWRSGPTTVAYGNSVTCTSCPSGYGVGAGSGTSQSSCTISVPAGKQLTAKSSSPTNCGANTWRSGPTTVAYGNSVSCTSCPSGYGVGAGSGTSQRSCTMSVGPGKRLVANASGVSNCPANTYRNNTVTAAYGDAVNCTGCPSGQFSGEGATGCTPCNRWVCENCNPYNSCSSVTWSSQNWIYYDSSCNRKWSGWVWTGASNYNPDSNPHWWFYFEGGYMKVGWVKDGGYWYYLHNGPMSDGSGCKSGRMYQSGNSSTSSSLYYNGTTYYFDSNGRCTNNNYGC